MQRFLMCLFLLCSTLAGTAQTISWGPENDLERAFQKYVGEKQGLHYFYTNTGRHRHFIQTVDSELKAVQESQIDLESEQGERKLLDLQFVGDRLYIFSLYNDRKEHKIYLYADEYSPSSLERMGTKTNIFVSNYPNINDAGEVYLKTSDDGKHLVILHQLEGKPKANREFAVQVMDIELHLVWENHFTLPASFEFSEIQDFIVDRDNQVYLAYMKYDKRPGSGKDGQIYQHAHVMQITGNGDVAVDHQPDFGPVVIGGLRLAEHKYGGCAVLGTFSNLNQKRAAGTVFCSVFDAVQDVSVDAFSLEELKQFMTDGKYKQTVKDYEKGKPLAELRDLVWREVRVRPTGEVVGLLETLDRVDEPVSAAYGGSPIWMPGLDGGWNNVGNNQYMMKEAMVVQYSDAGKRDFLSCIPKRQLSSDGTQYFGSLAMGIGEQSLYLIYNDNKNNLDELHSSDMNQLKSETNCEIMLATIDRSGTVNRSILVHPSSYNHICRPVASGQFLDSGTLLVFSRDNHKYFLGTLPLK